MKKIFLLLITFLLTILYAYPQEFSCPQVDCTGQCGAFVDANNDGFCDHGQLSEMVREAQRKLKEQREAKAAVSEKAEKKISEETKPAATAPTENPVCEPTTTDSAEQQENEAAFDNISDESNQHEPTAKKTSKYHLLSITFSLIIIYLISLLLVKKNIITKKLNHKIWNTALALAFLVSGILGMVLVFWINYDIRPDCYMTVKILHVEFGIAMAVITIFHLLWHFNYYKTIFKK